METSNTTSNTGRVGILLSGRGSNFEAIYRESTEESANFKIVTVISNKKKARGLERARELGIPAYYIAPRKYESREDYESAIVDILNEHQCRLVCLAGYMRLVGERLLQDFPNRIMNIHPALLPAFPGLDAQKQALEYGAKVSGCTVHFVDGGMDTGPIILQTPVPIEEGDDEETLSQRILTQEHRLYSKAISLFFSNKLKIQGRRVIILE